MYWQWGGGTYKISEFGYSMSDFDKHIKIAGIILMFQD